jgi:hypothetical protein
MLGYLFMMAVLIGLWAPEDDHDALDVRVVVFVILLGAIFPFLRAATLHLVHASINDVMFVSVVVPSQVIHWEAIVLAHLVNDLIEFCMAPTTSLGFVAFLFLGVSHDLVSMLTILLCQ